MSNQMTPLRRRMIDDMMIRNMSSLTQKIYVRARCFAMKPNFTSILFAK